MSGDACGQGITVGRCREGWRIARARTWCGSLRPLRGLSRPVIGAVWKHDSILAGALGISTDRVPIGETSAGKIVRLEEILRGVCVQMQSGMRWVTCLQRWKPTLGV